MNVLKSSTEMLTRLGDALGSKNDEQRRARAISAGVILIVLAVLFYYAT